MQQDILFEPMSASFQNDPHAFWRRVRAEDPLFRAEGWGIWLVTRHADVLAVLHDNDRFTARNAFMGGLATQETDEWTVETGNLPFLDPPDHTRVRRLFLQAFTPKVVNAMRASIQARIDALLDAVADSGEFDVIHDFAAHLPLAVICDLLGVPQDERTHLQNLALDVCASIDPGTSPENLMRAARGVGGMAEYWKVVIARRQTAPGDDLISTVLAVEEEGDKLSRNEIIGTLVSLGSAGHETTMNLIGNGMLAMMQDREQLNYLREHPESMRTGVEELARFAGPIQMGAAPRTATCDVEMHGKQIREGDVLRTVLASANRDPEVFADPERLDFRRTDVQAHVAYSHGAHFCLGAALARLETELAIRGLLDRFPKIDIAGPVEWKTDISVRGLTGLPVGTH